MNFRSRLRAFLAVAAVALAVAVPVLASSDSGDDNNGDAKSGVASLDTQAADIKQNLDDFRSLKLPAEVQEQILSKTALSIWAA